MRRESPFRLRRALNGALAATGLLYLVITFSPLVAWYAGNLAGSWGPERGDVLVVLGGARPNSWTIGSGTAVAVMDPSTYWRCYVAILYYREHPYRQIIVSGKDTAPGMRDFLVFNGIPAERIRVEKEADSTHENALFTARMLAGVTGQIVLVTSDSHMFRARRCFAKEGVPVAGAVAPDLVKRASEPAARMQLFFAELNETAKIAYYWYRGWI